MNRHVERYRETHVASSSPEELVSLLYEHLLKNLKLADKRIGSGDIEGKCESIQKALDIVYELMSSLDFSVQSEIPSRLASLYAFFAKEIGSAGRTLDRARLSRVTEMVASLNDSWDEARRSLVASRSPRKPPN